MRSADQAALQIDHAPLGHGVALDVALRRRQRSVSGQLLDVARAAACLDDLLGRSGDKRAAARVRAGTGKAEVLVEPMKPHLNRAGAFSYQEAAPLRVRSSGASQTRLERLPEPKPGLGFVLA